MFLITQCKAAFLLYTLPPSLHNIKDNPMTKNNLTYEQCYQRLMDITTETKQDDKAYAVTLARPSPCPNHTAITRVTVWYVYQLVHNGRCCT